MMITKIPFNSNYRSIGRSVDSFFSCFLVLSKLSNQLKIWTTYGRTNGQLREPESQRQLLAMTTSAAMWFLEPNQNNAIPKNVNGLCRQDQSSQSISRSLIVCTVGRSVQTTHKRRPKNSNLNSNMTKDNKLIKVEP